MLVELLLGRLGREGVHVTVGIVREEVVNGRGPHEHPRTICVAPTEEPEPRIELEDRGDEGLVRWQVLLLRRDPETVVAEDGAQHLEGLALGHPVQRPVVFDGEHAADVPGEVRTLGGGDRLQELPAELIRRRWREGDEHGVARGG